MAEALPDMTKSIELGTTGPDVYITRGAILNELGRPLAPLLHVEGPRRQPAAFYFSSVLAAAVTQMVVNQLSGTLVPTVGASGGLFGLLVGFAIMDGHDMGVGTLPVISAQLQAHGLSGDTPAAIIERATQPGQRTLTGTLATLPALAQRHDVRAPALIMIGTVVSLHAELAMGAGAAAGIR